MSAAWTRPADVTVAELIRLLEQLPADAVLHVEGDDFARPRLFAVTRFAPGERKAWLREGDEAVCLLDPAYGEVDHVDGRIRS